MPPTNPKKAQVGTSVPSRERSQKADPSNVDPCVLALLFGCGLIPLASSEEVSAIPLAINHLQRGQGLPHLLRWMFNHANTPTETTAVIPLPPPCTWANSEPASLTPQQRKAILDDVDSLLEQHLGWSLPRSRRELLQLGDWASMQKLIVEVEGQLQLLPRLSEEIQMALRAPTASKGKPAAKGAQKRSRVETKSTSVSHGNQSNTPPSPTAVAQAPETKPPPARFVQPALDPKLRQQMAQLVELQKQQQSLLADQGRLISLLVERERSGPPRGSLEPEDRGPTTAMDRPRQLSPLTVGSPSSLEVSTVMSVQETPSPAGSHAPREHQRKPPQAAQPQQSQSILLKDPKLESQLPSPVLNSRFAKKKRADASANQPAPTDASSSTHAPPPAEGESNFAEAVRLRMKLRAREDLIAKRIKEEEQRIQELERLGIPKDQWATYGVSVAEDGSRIPGPKQVSLLQAALWVQSCLRCHQTGVHWKAHLLRLRAVTLLQTFVRYRQNIRRHRPVALRIDETGKGLIGCLNRCRFVLSSLQQRLTFCPTLSRTKLRRYTDWCCLKCRPLVRAILLDRASTVDSKYAK